MGCRGDATVSHGWYHGHATQNSNSVEPCFRPHPASLRLFSRVAPTPSWLHPSRTQRKAPEPRPVPSPNDETPPASSALALEPSPLPPSSPSGIPLLSDPPPRLLPLAFHRFLAWTRHPLRHSIAFSPPLTLAPFPRTRFWVIHGGRLPGKRLWQRMTSLLHTSKGLLNRLFDRDGGCCMGRGRGAAPLHGVMLPIQWKSRTTGRCTNGYNPNECEIHLNATEKHGAHF